MIINNVHYEIDMCGGAKIWCLTGNVTGHTRFPDDTKIVTSCPTYFDEERLWFKTMSGSKYQIESFQGKKEDLIAQIKKDVAAGGYECH